MEMMGEVREPALTWLIFFAVFPTHESEAGVKSVNAHTQSHISVSKSRAERILVLLHIYGCQPASDGLFVFGWEGKKKEKCICN